MRGATIKRCSWVSVDDPLMLQYHDREWGVPVHDDRKHFEFLVLEGAQAGLSWTIVLKKREGYRRAFDEFDPEKVARFSARRIETLALDSAIIRNRMKIEAAVAGTSQRSPARYVRLSASIVTVISPLRMMWDRPRSAHLARRRCG